jgi:hypothetical protein
MNIKEHAANVFIGILALALCAAVMYFFLAAILDKLASINSDLMKALIGAGFAAIVTAMTIVLGKIWELKIKIKQDIRDKKIPIYENQLETFFKLFFSEKLGKEKVADRDLVAAFVKFSEKIMIWGSSEVIAAWEEFRSASAEPLDAARSLLAFEAFILALRKDIGNSNKSLKKGDLLKLFINGLNFDEIRRAQADL